MKCNTRRNGMFVLALAVFLVFLPSANAVGLGIGPVSLKLTNAARGQDYTNLITLYSTFDTPINLSLSSDGSCKNWILFYLYDDMSNPITSVNMNPMSSKQVMTKITIPKCAPAGTYLCSMYSQQTVQTGSNESVVAVRVKTDVTITVVGDELPQGIVRGIEVLNPELGSPLVIIIDFENTGNVTATPLVFANISKGDKSIFKIEYNQTSVAPGQTSTIRIEKITSGMGLGEYQMPMSISLICPIEERKDMSFNIVEKGSQSDSSSQATAGGSDSSGSSAGGSVGSSSTSDYSTESLKTIQIYVSYEGKILEVKVPEKIILGDMVKTEITFSNTGNADLRAKAREEIYSNGKFVNVIQGDEISLKTGETRTLTLYFKPENAGNYQIKPSVVYEGKEITIDPVSFTVSESSMFTGMMVLIPGLGILGIVVVVVSIVLWNKKKHKQQYVLRKRWGH